MNGGITSTETTNSITDVDKKKSPIVGTIAGDRMWASPCVFLMDNGSMLNIAFCTADVLDDDYPLVSIASGYNLSPVRRTTIPWPTIKPLI